MKHHKHWHQLLTFLLMTTAWPHGSEGWSIAWKGGLKNDPRFSLIFPGMYFVTGLRPFHVDCRHQIPNKFSDQWNWFVLNLFHIRGLLGM
jgi:hypothetical protein